MASDIERDLRGLVLSATELRDMHPTWDGAFIEDYLNILNNLVTIVGHLDAEIDKKIEETDTDLTDGSIPYADSNLLTEDNTNLLWDATSLILKVKALRINDATASRLLSTNATKDIVSVADLTSWVAGTASEIDVVSDGSGGVVIGIVDPLIVGKGGTGASSLTDGGILVGSGTGAITALAQATNGQIPIGSTGGDPVLSTLTAGSNISITNGAGTITIASSSGNTQNTTRVTSSPYAVLSTDNNIFCDTDGGAITVNLPAGVNGTKYRVINCGSSGNNVTLTPNGTELLFGANAGYAITDGNRELIVYETTEGWW